jgi:hypothetical protein
LIREYFSLGAEAGMAEVNATLAEQPPALLGAIVLVVVRDFASSGSRAADADKRSALMGLLRGMQSGLSQASALVSAAVGECDELVNLNDTLVDAPQVCFSVLSPSSLSPLFALSSPLVLTCAYAYACACACARAHLSFFLFF